jgi:hypothetical protein
MDDALHQIGLAAWWDVLEEVAGLHGGAGCEIAAEVSVLAGASEYVLLVCEYAA